jgi:hypothetical protein
MVQSTFAIAHRPGLIVGLLPGYPIMGIIFGLGIAIIIVSIRLGMNKRP